MNATEKTKPLAGKIILLVEDDPSLQDIYRTALTVIGGAEVVMAENGEEGLTQFESNKVNAVIFDIMMPKMNGYEFIRNLKDNPAVKGIPFIALTSLDAHPEYLKKSTGVDVAEYLIKTNISPEELVERVAKHVKA